MKKLKLERKEETSGVRSRRNFVKKSGALLLAGGVAGPLGNAFAMGSTPQSPNPNPPPAPPLPWKWTELDPMEAGTLAYKTYLEKGG